jgi:hypothetical protein
MSSGSICPTPPIVPDFPLGHSIAGQDKAGANVYDLCNDPHNIDSFSPVCHGESNHEKDSRASPRSMGDTFLVDCWFRLERAFSLRSGIMRDEETMPGATDGMPLRGDDHER